MPRAWLKWLKCAARGGPSLFVDLHTILTKSPNLRLKRYHLFRLEQADFGRPARAAALPEDWSFAWRLNSVSVENEPSVVTSSVEGDWTDVS